MAKDLLAWAEEIGEKAKQRRLIIENTTPSQSVIKLPYWPESTRGVPNDVLRSALFGAVKKGKKLALERHPIAAPEGLKILYTGTRLDQGDLDVWESVLHITRFHEMGQQYRFTAYSMLKVLGKTDTGKNREILHRRLLRLRSGTIEIIQDKFTYVGGLIEEIYKDEKTVEYVVILNKKLRPLFDANRFTQIDLNIRNALSGKPLAQWLHGFYASHAKPYAYSVEKLHELCGSEATRLDNYRQDLRKALNAIIEASRANGQKFSYSIQEDLVHIEKKPSDSQKRHLITKKSRTLTCKKNNH